MTGFQVFPVSKLAAAALILGTVLTASAPAQTVKDLVGTWTWVSIEGTRPDGTKYQPFGPSPKGHIVFDANGRFAFLLTSSGRPRFVSNNREQGTAEENAAAMKGSIAYSGTYSVNDKTLIFNVEASTYPNAEATQQKRTITVTADELRYFNPSPTMGGTAEVILKRVK
jgi:lipocalin-like protein